MIIWFIGMSGSGKTTLARTLYDRLKPAHANLIYLDGDEFRRIFRDDVDHSMEGRRKNAERISNFCKVLDQQDIHVIASVLSIFPEWQEWNRRNFSRYFEIFLDVPMEELERRDTKGLYEGARLGSIENVVGFDIEFPLPLHPDLVIDEKTQKLGVDECVSIITSQMPKLSG